MSENTNGGAAFPTSHSADYPGEITGGMTLRDYFAAKAMQGICSHQDTWGFSVAEIGAQAYGIADVMLAARGAA